MDIKTEMSINLFPKSRKGSKILSIYWFVILAITAGGLWGMIYIFYGAPYDIRSIEANILVNKVADCVSYAGKIDAGLISEGTVKFQKTEEDFLKDCHLNFETAEWQEPQYYAEVDFYKLSDLANPVLSVKAGNKNFASYCAVQEEKKEGALPQCIQKSFYSVDNANNQYIIKISTIVRKSEKNVKL